MREIGDKRRLEHFFGKQQAHFRQRPPVLKLVKFEKGEILNDPLQPLNCFYIIVKGSVSIYSLTEDGSIRYISKAAMTDYSYYSQKLGDRQSAVIEIKLWESSLADNQISSVSDIQEMEFGLEMKADNTTIDEPTLALMLEKSD